MTLMFQAFRNGNAFERDEKNKCMAKLSSYSLKNLVWLMGERPDLIWDNKFAPKLFLEVQSNSVITNSRGPSENVCYNRDSL